VRTADFFGELVADQKRGLARGICSVCSAHPVVLEAAMLQALDDGVPVLIESTVNQVNQFGGYTGMSPGAFSSFVDALADTVGLPRNQLILGGDHLGPYPWRSEGAAEAMLKSREVVVASVLAGYTKIHLDASMPLGDDPPGGHGALDPRLVAAREADLAAAAENAFHDRQRSHPDASPPVFVIGTEVPPPGGIPSGEEAVPATRVKDLLETVFLCEEAFRGRGLDDAWERTCAVVAQPGVEFGDEEVHEYDRARAAPLCRAARGVPGIVLEGHSTDYQAPEHLRQLVEDGVAILKVGPALTFALRECLFGLEAIERELLRGKAGGRPSSLAETLDGAMTANPLHWAGYYTGTDDQQRRARKYSLSDRSRYYWAVPEVEAAVRTLVENLRRSGIPLTLLSQFLPVHHRRVRTAGLDSEPAELLRESVRQVLRDYSAAVSSSEPGSTPTS
jgi:D-tagatose-1,6-bisphosphate aldolase subunit GatZ/KbaZ